MHMLWGFEFALKKPVSRLLVNTPGTLGGVGASTGIQPALTLGCGAVGGSATADNVGPMNLIDIRRVAFGLKELDEVRGNYPAPEVPCCQAPAPRYPDTTCAASGEKAMTSLSKSDIEAITRAVLAHFNK